MPIGADTFKALGDPTRLSLFELLVERPHRVNELVTRLAVAQPVVSRHLRLLKEAGLVEDQREGRGVTYRIAAGDGAPPSLLRDWAVEAAARTARSTPARRPDAARPRETSRTSEEHAFVVLNAKDSFDSYLL